MLYEVSKLKTLFLCGYLYDIRSGCVIDNYDVIIRYIGLINHNKLKIN